MSSSYPRDENIVTAHQISGLGELCGMWSSLVFKLQIGHRGFRLPLLKRLGKCPPTVSLGHSLDITEIAAHRNQSEGVWGEEAV